MASGFCSRTVRLTDPALIQLVETVAQIKKCSLERVISDAVAYRYGAESLVEEHEELPMHFVSEEEDDVSNHSRHR